MDSNAIDLDDEDDGAEGAPADPNAIDFNDGMCAGQQQHQQHQHQQQHQQHQQQHQQHQHQQEQHQHQHQHKHQQQQQPLPEGWTELTDKNGRTH